MLPLFAFIRPPSDPTATSFIQDAFIPRKNERGTTLPRSRRKRFGNAVRKIAIVETGMETRRKRPWRRQTTLVGGLRRWFYVIGKYKPELNSNFTQNIALESINTNLLRRIITVYNTSMQAIKTQLLLNEESIQCTLQRCIAIKTLPLNILYLSKTFKCCSS